MTTPDPANTAFPYAPINDAPRGFKPNDEQLRELLAPLASIDLGVYDRRILDWLANWDWSTAGTFASLLWRARAAQPLPPADTEPRFDLIYRRSMSSAVGTVGGHVTDRNLTTAELDTKLAEHGVTRHEGDKGRVTLSGGLQLLWQPAGTEAIQ